MATHWLMRYGFRLIGGGASLWVLNTLGTTVHFHLPLNMATAAVAGVLGLPGVLALAALQRLW